MNDRKNAFHLRFENRKLIPNLKLFIEEVLAPIGINMIILEIDKSYVFTKHPEIKIGSNALNAADAKEITSFAKRFGIEIVPLMQCLGHQGWGGSRSALLTAYPEFDETPETPLDAEWPEIFCRSWCPNHPEVNEVVFDMMDEIIDSFSANYFHIGMDEVYEIASEQCHRCRDKNRADLFAKSVNDMYSHIVKKRGLKVMMWADRLIDANQFGYDKWEADMFGTHKAINDIPKDIILLDWHYDERKEGYLSPRYFMEQGFSVMPACWFKQNVAKKLFEQTEEAANQLDSHHLLFGNLVTSWHNWDAEAFEQFITFKEKIESNDSEQGKLFRTLQYVGAME